MFLNIVFAMVTFANNVGSYNLKLNFSKSTTKYSGYGDLAYISTLSICM